MSIIVTEFRRDEIGTFGIYCRPDPFFGGRHSGVFFRHGGIKATNPPHTKLQLKKKKMELEITDFDFDDEISQNDETSIVSTGFSNIYSESGVSALKGMKTSSNWFSKYLRHLHDVDSSKFPYSEYQQTGMDEEIFTPNLIGEFGDYLIKIAKIKRVNTTLAYLKGLKSLLEKDYPSTEAMFSKGTWYTKLRANIGEFTRLFQLSLLL